MATGQAWKVLNTDPEGKTLAVGIQIYAPFQRAQPFRYIWASISRGCRRSWPYWNFRISREKIAVFRGGGIVPIASIWAVAAHTGVPGWPRGAVCPQGGPCYELVMEPRQSAYNRRVTPGPTRTHFWLFYAILEVGARTSPPLYHGPTPRPSAGRLRFRGGAEGITAGAGYPAAPFRPSHGLPTASKRMESCPFNGHGPSWLRLRLYLDLI